MVRDPVLECSFLIPVRRDPHLSDGRLHDRVVWRWLRRELFVRFGGATLAPGRYSGFYTDPDTGEQVSDESRRYFVALPKERVRELRIFLKAVCVEFYQKCIYLNVAGRVELVEAGTDDP